MGRARRTVARPARARHVGRRNPARPVTAHRIDVHAHDYPTTYLEAITAHGEGLTHYTRDDGRLVVKQDDAVALTVPQPLPTVEERVRRMDESGVRTQVLSISAPSVYLLPDSMRVSVAADVNDRFVDVARRQPGRFRVFATVPLPDVGAAIDELERCAHFPEVVGVFLCSTVARRSLDDDLFEPFWDYLSQRKSVVFVHPSVACCTDGLTTFALSLSVDYFAETTLAITRLTYSGVFERYPGTRWIFSHMGGSLPMLVNRLDNYYRQFPECQERLHRLPTEVIRGLYFDTATSHVPAIRCAIDSLGSDRLLFGTDYPHVPGGMAAFVDALGSCGLGSPALADIESRTAAALLGL